MSAAKDAATARPSMDAEPGEHISIFAERLCAARRRGTFNDILLDGTNSTPVQVAADYDRLSAERDEAWRRSPEGIAAAIRQRSETERLQAECDALIARLPSLDFTDDAAVLDWLCAYQAPSDYMLVQKDNAAVLTAFKAAGFKTGANVGEDYDGNNRDNSFSYLVGQAMDCIESVGAIHSVLLSMADDWRRRFLARGESQ
jgi:hypothetical protein